MITIRHCIVIILTDTVSASYFADDCQHLPFTSPLLLLVGLTVTITMLIVKMQLYPFFPGGIITNYNIDCKIT